MLRLKQTVIRLPSQNCKIRFDRVQIIAVAQWLRCCSTNRKVAGSIPAGVNGFFIDIKSFRSHYGPGVDSALTEMSTRSISWG